jgi:hypothetical protein
MNNSGNGGEVNHNFHIVEPEDELTSLRKRIANLEMVNETLNETLKILIEAILTPRPGKESGGKREETIKIPLTVKAPITPKEKDPREMLLQEVSRVISVLDPEIRFGAVAGNIWYGEKDNVYRLYLVPDHSYLYVNRDGKLLPGYSDKRVKVKTLLAARLLDRFREVVPYFAEMEPPIEAPLLREAL